MLKIGSRVRGWMCDGEIQGTVVEIDNYRNNTIGVDWDESRYGDQFFNWEKPGHIEEI